MNQLSNIQTQTMSSREIAELVDRVVDGSASQTEAEALAFRIISSIFYEFKRGFNLSFDEIDREDAKLTIDSVEHAHSVVSQSANSFIHYPSIKESIQNACLVNSCAQTVLLPALFDLNPQKNNYIVKTYLAKHPSSGLIKIGRSINPIERMKQLQTGAGAPLIILAQIDDDVENELHQKFSHLRRSGEWFYDDGSLSEFVNEIKARDIV